MMIVSVWTRRLTPPPHSPLPQHVEDLCSNATDAPMYTSLSLFKDGGMAALTAAPMETSTMVANAPLPPTMTPPKTTVPMPKATATLMTSFVKHNLI